MEAHATTLDPEDGFDVLIHPAPDHVVQAVLDAPIGTGDGRSPWMFIRLPNGDLILGVFPQGETYESLEVEAEYTGPRGDTLWCETCGERPQVVHAKDAGLCGKCAADVINRLSASAGA